MNSEDIILVLETMAFGNPCRTEKEALEEAIDHIKNDSLNMCRRILDMIRINGATSYEIREFCENYIHSKEEE